MVLANLIVFTFAVSSPSTIILQCSHEESVCVVLSTSSQPLLAMEEGFPPIGVPTNGNTDTKSVLKPENICS